MCALQHFVGIDSSFSDYRTLNVEFGNMNGIILTIHLQSCCSSPFLGKYVGSLTPEHYWMTLFLSGKELIIDRKELQAKYPEKIPFLFRSAPIENYMQDVCIFLCQSQKQISWDLHSYYKLGTCDMDEYGGPSKGQHELCAYKDCPNETVFASIDYFVEHLRWDDTNLSETQQQNIDFKGATLWIKSDCTFYTVKNINIEKKFEEFLAEIGGNFGLFVGASILTFVEIGVLLVRVLKGFINNQRKLLLTKLKSELFNKV